MWKSLSPEAQDIYKQKACSENEKLFEVLEQTNTATLSQNEEVMDQSNLSESESSSADEANRLKQ